jgi:membrane protease YdiL (CAAX protease family)
MVSWYFINLSNYFLKENDFANLLYINDIFSFAFNVLGHIIFLGIIYSYFNLLYDFNFKDLGFYFKKDEINLKILFIALIFLSLGIILININFIGLHPTGFFPVKLSDRLLARLFSEIPLICAILFASFFTACVEQFLFNKIIFSIFNLYLPKLLAAILTALFGSIIFLEFNPAFMLIIFLVVLISNYLYLINNNNLLAPTIFYSIYLTLYIVFIYGFDFMLIKFS